MSINKAKVLIIFDETEAAISLLMFEVDDETLENFKKWNNHYINSGDYDEEMSNFFYTEDTYEFKYNQVNLRTPINTKELNIEYVFIMGVVS